MGNQKNRPFPSLSKLKITIARTNRGRFVAWIALLASLTILLGALFAPLWLPRTIRAVIPDRYIAAYAPKPLQEIIFERQGTGSQLPTVSVENDLEASKLLETPTLPPALKTATPTPTLAPIPSEYFLSGLTHTYQGWNNCGPATFTTTLSYWGVETTQRDVANFVKPNPEDRNVRPDELAAYVETKGLKAVVRINGTMDLLKRFIAAGYPVVIEQGFEVEDLGWMGHYVVLTGYSDKSESFTSMDSYLGPDHIYPYARIEKYWWHFSNLYVVVYRPDQAQEVASIIGPQIDDDAMYSSAIETARTDLAQNPTDAFGWFNLGSAMTALGRFDDAAAAFDQARQIGLPWRMLWYQFAPYQAYLAVGRYDDVRLLADTTLFDDVYSEEAYYYKGEAYLKQGEQAKARDQFEKAVLYNKHYSIASDALSALGN